MTPKEERAYEEGRRRGMLTLLQTIVGELAMPLAKDGGSGTFDAARLLAERHEAIARLRRICGEHGDNDWDDTLHLADIIEKHLGRHLDRG